MPVQLQTTDVTVTRVEKIDCTEIFYPSINIDTDTATGVSTCQVQEKPYAIVDGAPVFASVPNRIVASNFATAAANLAAAGYPEFGAVYAPLVAALEAASKYKKDRQADCATTVADLSTARAAWVDANNQVVTAQAALQVSISADSQLEPSIPSEPSAELLAARADVVAKRNVLNAAVQARTSAATALASAQDINSKATAALSDFSISAID